MLYIPQFWWHQVRSYENPNIAVGIWFNIFNFFKEFERRQIDETEQVIKVALWLIFTVLNNRQLYWFNLWYQYLYYYSFSDYPKPNDLIFKHVPMFLAKLMFATWRTPLKSIQLKNESLPSNCAWFVNCQMLSILIQRILEFCTISCICIRIFQTPFSSFTTFTLLLY